jgi:hypothetical protein
MPRWKQRMESKLDYKLVENGVHFSIVECTPIGGPDLFRTDIVEWTQVHHLRPFPTKEPHGYQWTDLFWLQPVRTWVAYVFTSIWEGGGSLIQAYEGPFRYPYLPPPSGLKRRSANNEQRLVHTKLQAFFNPIIQFRSDDMQSVFIATAILISTSQQRLTMHFLAQECPPSFSLTTHLLEPSCIM